MGSHHLLLEVPKSALTKLDGRSKLFLSVLALLAVVSASRWQYPLSGGLFSLAILYLAGISPALILKRLLPVLAVALLIGLSQLFFFGYTGLFSLQLGPFHLAGYREGIERGALLASRVFGGMSVMLFLTFSTTVQEWISALAWFKVPLTVVEIMTMAYSSVFVLLEELSRLHKAQRMRLGYRSWWLGVKASGAIGGVLFSRVFDKSQRLWQAMLCRGYNGQIRVVYLRKLSRLDFGFASLGALLIAATWVWAR